ncbi:MAG: hypothetical protein A3F04_01125 [Candidatus Chisholmbacteria bacterium RIFCSPHIGHO2_12_FULL_49_9]|uniref:Phosphoribosyltransferase domain-containing protein n=1 Tax=Candidatus Chisholmbacteria bacterium RIFCSPHIGHO2_01_FULL_52_32 TaxID=1797591 RepID=A0A1G1VQT7_9BACT|nr:MAG: hypothetical protein A2786_00335 [Candidatus Chisholmbacteria bacterium RIFCSPHIGHO2_01_FULL_52_32]OGY20729.1 MAG: hypothetical protein A2900_00100 [Candidatus Chisholmbacteria bacterium RIFCSPLOWO2_01_FULL_50_28]OGY20910.1 MAG: hypothetical protein A3F04_01125 [Candidatus Chisholmbacteria bacterium RIFCSPHIGHO2_12_FULL_49_9]
MAKVFSDRKEAGRLLSRELFSYSNHPNALVLAVPRGGVVVGYEVSRTLHLPLDVIVTKKIGAPSNAELAIGAMAEDGKPIFEEELLSKLGIEKEDLPREMRRVSRTIQEYIRIFREGRSLVLKEKVVIVVDDGVATGATLEAALSWLRTQRPKEIILAVPTGARDSMTRLERLADRTICLDKPEWFSAVGQFYREFGQVTDEEVKRILSAS